MRFKERDAFEGVMKVETARALVDVRNAERLTMGVTVHRDERYRKEMHRIEKMALQYEAEIVPDRRYQLEPPPCLRIAHTVPEGQTASLDEVLSTIRAKQAWGTSRGEGVSIAIVDTGIDGEQPEFPDWKRQASIQQDGIAAWSDYDGHGTMCACIAAGSAAEGGRFSGVAPDAKLISCRTEWFRDSEVTLIYDQLTARREAGETIVVSNSFGIPQGVPPSPSPDDDLPNALFRAAEAGIHIFFSAGNYHQDADGVPDDCQPNTIWLHKSMDYLSTVATCDLDRKMWYYSSRGPGQLYGEPSTNEKPDCTAPTPKYGQILYGDSIEVMENGWGTSGASPQVAGLAALLLSINPALALAQIRHIIRNSAVDLGHGWTCQVAGMIDCVAAVGSAATPSGS